VYLKSRTEIVDTWQVFVCNDYCGRGGRRRRRRRRRRKRVRVWRSRQEGGEHGQKEIRTRRQRGEDA
jgi:hypothetical protein